MQKNTLNLFDSTTQKIDEINYYQKENLKDPIEKDEALKLIEYYKVFINKNTGLPIREELYQEYNLSKYSIFFYDSKNRIINTRTYTKNNLLISEIIYKYINQDIDKIEFFYTYFDDDTKMKAKKRYKNNQKDGIWAYFDQDGSTIKEEFYKNDILRKSWIKGTLEKN